MGQPTGATGSRQRNGVWPPPASTIRGPYVGPYVLVADADSQRATTCVTAIEASGARARVSQDGAQAIALVERYGAPTLLIVDLSLPNGDGFAVIAAATGPGRRPAIIAWSDSRGTREFAAAYLAGSPAHVLDAKAPPSVIRGAIERGLALNARHDRDVSGERGERDERVATADPAEMPTMALAEKARQLSGAAGVAIYSKTPNESQFRASVGWMSDTPLPQSPAWLPDVFNLVLEGAQPIVLPNLERAPASARLPSMLEGDVRGIIAVPLTRGPRRIVGMICVFDVHALTIADSSLDALIALGDLEAEIAAEPPFPTVAESAGSTGTPDREALEDPPRVHSLDAPQDWLPVPSPTARQDWPPVQSSPVPQDWLPAPSPPVPQDQQADDGLAIQCEVVRREQGQLSVIRLDFDPHPSTSGSVAPASGCMTTTASKTLKRVIRGSDVAIQWDREQLLVVLPGLSLEEALKVADRVRAAMQAGAEDARVAGGVAELLPNEPFESAVARASEKLQLARRREQDHFS